MLEAGSDEGFDRIVEHMESLLDEVSSQSLFRNAAPDSWRPAVNIYESPAKYVICVDLAGMHRDQIDVLVDSEGLVIRGFRPKPMPDDSPDEISVHVMEIDSGRFHRRISLPADIDVDQVEAKYRKGFLWITMDRRGADDAR